MAVFEEPSEGKEITVLSLGLCPFSLGTESPSSSLNRLLALCPVKEKCADSFQPFLEELFLNTWIIW